MQSERYDSYQQFVPQSHVINHTRIYSHNCSSFLTFLPVHLCRLLSFSFDDLRLNILSHDITPAVKLSSKSLISLLNITVSVANGQSWSYMGINETVNALDWVIIDCSTVLNIQKQFVLAQQIQIMWTGNVFPLEHLYCTCTVFLNDLSLSCCVIPRSARVHQYKSNYIKYNTQVCRTCRSQLSGSQLAGSQLDVYVPI